MKDYANPKPQNKTFVHNICITAVVVLEPVENPHFRMWNRHSVDRLYLNENVDKNINFGRLYLVISMHFWMIDGMKVRHTTYNSHYAIISLQWHLSSQTEKQKLHTKTLHYYQVYKLYSFSALILHHAKFQIVLKILQLRA